jgi:ABC-type transport system substrate-binding protein
MANDGLSVTFKMRPNVKFHNVAPVNGRVMDIDDWKTTLERFLALSAQREPLLELLDKAEYPDSQTLVMRLKFPYAPFMDRIHSERFAFQVLPKELNVNQELAARTSIGTSYKVLDRHQPSVAMEYKKHAEYWAGEPYIDRWSFPIVTEYANRYAQFVSGNIIDFAPNSRDVLKLAQDVPGAVIVAQPINEEQFARIIFGREQAETKPWKDPRVRIAVRRATDMRGIGEFQANKTQFEAAGIPVEVRSRSHLMSDPRYWLDPEKNELGPVSQNYLHSIDEARKLIMASGATLPIEIDFRVLPSGGETPEEERLTIDSLNRSGLFKVTQTKSVNTVEHRNCRSLRQCVGIVTSSTNEDADYALREYFSKGPRPGGEPAYPSPNLDRLAEAYRREQDLQRRIALLKEVQQAAGEFFPTVPRPHQFTSFTFRWPWLRNTNHGWNGVSLDGRPIWGGYKQWLASDMPRRNG